jgi:hypothetical protein
MMIGENDAAVSRVHRFQAAGPRSPYDMTVILRVLDAAGRCAEVDSLLGPRPRRTLGVMRCHAWTSPAVDSTMAIVRGTAPYLRAWSFARYYALSGNADRALEMLEQAFRDREAWMPFIQHDPGFQSLYADLRFRDLVRRVAAAAGGA